MIVINKIILKMLQFNRALPGYLESMPLNVFGTKSKYNNASTYLQISYSVHEVFRKYAQVNNGCEVKCSCAVDKNNRIITEYEIDDDVYECCVINENGSVMASVIDRNKNNGALPYTVGESEKAGYVLLFALIPQILEDEEAYTAYKEIENELRKDLTETVYCENESTFSTNLAILSENVRRRVAYSNTSADIKLVIDDSKIKATLPLLSENQINRGVYEIYNYYCGKLHVFEKNDTVDNYHIKHKDFIGKYMILPTELTEEYLNEFPSTYVIPEFVLKLCKQIQLSTNTGIPVRNILLHGGSGGGKTEGVKALSKGLGLTYQKQTCHPDYDITDLFGKIMPIEDESSNTKFKYVESELIKTIRYGGVCEIQEALIIERPGVLTGLNGILDGDTVELPTGELLKRHSNSIIIITTNIDYVDCSEIQQSVLSRMQRVMLIDEMTKSEMINRAMIRTGCKDIQLVTNMVDITKNINNYCREMQIKDGVCGMRELMDWVTETMIFGNPYQSAIETIINKASMYQENREQMISQFLSTSIFALEN